MSLTRGQLAYVIAKVMSQFTVSEGQFPDGTTQLGRSHRFLFRPEPGGPRSRYYLTKEMFCNYKT